MHRPWIAAGPALLACALAGDVAAGPAPTGIWKLAASDVAKYEQRSVTLKDGKEILGGPRAVRFDGHAVRDGVLRVGEPMREDLPEILALSAPADNVEWRCSVVDAAELRISAKVGAHAPDAASWTIEWQFDTPRAAKSDAWEIHDGTAHAAIVFDAALGVVRSSRLEVAYSLDPVEKSKDRKPSRVHATWQFDFVDATRWRYPKFQSDVDGAIDRGVAKLRKFQKDDGSYEPKDDWFVGSTALGAYTLSACGVPRDDPNVDKALSYVCAHADRRTYSLATGLMAMERAYAPLPGSSTRAEMPADRRAWCEQAAAALESIPGTPGSWNYPPPPRYIAEPDSSNTQYAVLGLLAATKLGIAVRETTWTGVVRHFEHVREKDAPRGAVSLLLEGHSTSETTAPTPVANAAGFRYRTTQTRPWGAMTCAGIASLVIAKSELARTKSSKLEPLSAEIDEMIAGGWAWLDANWRVDRHVGHPGDDWHYYYIYAIERAGILSNVHLVGGRDWYFEGAVELLANQDAEGAWDERNVGKLSGTCFALLFLKRATAPITPK